MSSLPKVSTICAPEGFVASPGRTLSCWRASCLAARPLRWTAALTHLTKKQDAILDWIAQRYDWRGVAILPLNDEGLFEADISVYSHGDCRVRVTVDDEYGVTVVEFIEGDGC